MIVNILNGMYYNFIIVNNLIEKVILIIVLVGTVFVFIFLVVKCK